MIYYSTNNGAKPVDFKTAVIEGQPADKGLYFPSDIPKLEKDFLRKDDSISREELAFRILQPYIGSAIPEVRLQEIISHTLSFDFPLVQITHSIWSLELFHGPTLAFKDVGAKFMSSCLGYFVKEIQKRVVVLVATSGDTGGAVANGFYDVEGIEVVILYPEGKVSEVQELQLVTPGKNITAIAINGSFDDCQQMVKQAFTDPGLNAKMLLTSANSINVARWLPQQLYYFFAYQQWPTNEAPIFSVPSGNFGNLCAGILAYSSGLPVKQFIAACNANKVVPDFLETERFEPRPYVSTLSNAMDVGNPSNFIRILEIFDHNLPELKKMLVSYSITDDETKAAIKFAHDRYGYLLDPHGAVAFASLQKYQQQVSDSKGIFFETAHPVKFYDTVRSITNKEIDMPASVKGLFSKQRSGLKMEKNFASLKDLLLTER
jgi:threonine synthase